MFLIANLNCAQMAKKGYAYNKERSKHGKVRLNEGRVIYNLRVYNASGYGIVNIMRVGMV